MVKFFFLLFSLQIFPPEEIFSQADSAAQEKNFLSTIGQDFSFAFDDAESVGKKIVRLDWSDAAIAGGILGGAVLLHTQDQELREIAQRNHTPQADVFMNIGREYGQTYTGAGIGGALYLGGLFTESEEVRTTGRCIIEALALAGVVSSVTKVAVGRARPYNNLGPDEFRGMQWTNDFWSFPSGHSNVAFTVSSVLSSRIDRWWASVGLYSLAGLTAYSRVYHDQHWLSDVFTGAAIGTISGLTITHIQDEREKNSSEKKSSLIITPNGIYYSYTL